MHHRERQSPNVSDLSDLSATDVYSPPWMKDLIMKKREKLVEIVTKQDHNIAQLNFSSPSSKGGKTSIGSNTSITTVGSIAVKLSPIASSGAFTNCCQSCLSSQGDSSHCSCESGFNSKKAVHLSNSSSSVNVPIQRSVSSSLTCRPCSRCLVCDSIQCINQIHNTSNDLSSSVNKSNQFNSNSNCKCCSSQLIDLNGEQVSPGFVATRRTEILKRQVSESSFFFQTCNICGSKTYAQNNQYYRQSLISEKMIDDKIKDDSSEYLNNDRNHHYEVIMDYKRSNSVNSSEKGSIISNGVETDGKEENDYEYKYGPGIVDKLKLKFMSISIQQQTKNLKRCSSLENIAVSNDSHILQSLQQQQHLSHNTNIQSQANDLLLPKNGAVLSVGSITGGGNRANGNHLSHRLYIQHHNSKNIYNNNKSTAIVPVIKRAKSMETLLFQDDKDKGRQPLNCLFHHQLSMPETPFSSHIDSQLVNENVLIIENTNNEINECQNKTTVDKAVNLSTMKSASNLINELSDELPKPDTVKTYKRIFEPNNMTISEDVIKTGVLNNNKSKNNYKKTLPPTNGNVKRKPPVLRATNKNTSLKSSPVNSSSSPTIKSQPPLVPQVVSSPNNRSSISNSVVIEDNNHNKSANSPVMTKPPIAPKRPSLTSTKSSSDRVIHHSNDSSITTGPKKPEKGIKLISTESLDRIRASGTSVTFNGSDQSSTPCPISQIIPTAYDSSEKTPNKPKVNKPIANIKPFTQNNDSLKSEIVNNQSVINDYNNGRDLGQNSTNDMPIGEKANVQLVETNHFNNNNKDDKDNNEIASQSVFSNTTVIPTTTSTEFKESNNENIVAVNDENVSPNSCDSMVDRNKVQRIEDHSQTDVLKSSLLLNSGQSLNSNKSLKSSLWSQQAKKPTNSSTTIVFDFRGKDVKSNLAINPAPFGVLSSATKRSSKKTPKDGSINTNGSVSDSEDDENYTGSLDIPPPSGIKFMGENVKVGKGSILSTRNKKLNIQFNDSAIATFEYPSEASLLAETPISNQTTSVASVKDEIKSEANNSVIEAQSQSSNTLTTLKTNLVLGGSSGGLASYKPTLLDTPFELGVSRTHKTNSKTEIITNELNSENIETDAVKPATPDETTSWSTSSTASDLLF